MMDQDTSTKRKAEVAQQRARAFVSAEIARSATSRETGPKQGERQQAGDDGDPEGRQDRARQGDAPQADGEGQARRGQIRRQVRN